MNAPLKASSNRGAMYLATMTRLRPTSCLMIKLTARLTQAALLPARTRIADRARPDQLVGVQEHEEGEEDQHGQRAQGERDGGVGRRDGLGDRAHRIFSEIISSSDHPRTGSRALA